MAERSLVKNANDPGQVEFAERKVTRANQKRHDLITQQLATYPGREFMWAEIERHGVYDLVGGPAETVWTFLGRREAGILLLVECMRDHPTQFLQMQHEALARAAALQRELDAQHTKKQKKEAPE